MGSSEYRMTFKTDAIYTVIVVSIMAAFLGLSGWTFCLKVDGRLSLKLSYLECRDFLSEGSITKSEG
jgi:hypothetical protein